MEKLNEKYHGHLFICTNKKEKGSCCYLKGAEHLQREIKEWIKNEPQLKGLIKVSKSGCLGHCEKGIAAVLYPHQDWFIDITASDLEAIKRQLQSCVK